MLTEPLIQQLHTLRLNGMASALEQQRASPDLTDCSFEDRLGLMIQQEMHRTLRLPPGAAPALGEAADAGLRRGPRHPRPARPRSRRSSPR